MRSVWTLAVLALAVPALCDAQSLGAAAAKEKQRREEAQRKRNGAAKTVTEDDLASYGAKESPASSAPEEGAGGASPDPTPRARTGAPPAKRPQPLEITLPGAEETATPSQAEGDSDRSRLVGEFRRRHSSAEADVRRAEAALADAEEYLDKVKRTPVVRDGTREHADSRVEAARAELERAKEARDDIEDEARRAGLYPGDLR
jgi:hypothetical protein